LDPARAPNVEAGQLDQLPAARFRTPPIYPLAMRREALGGEVLVDFTVDANGEVVDVHATGSTRPEFEKAAVDAVKMWEFRPGESNRQRVNSPMRVPVIFRMEAMKSEPPELDRTSAERVLLAPFQVMADPPKPGEVLPSSPQMWF
jgi:TonB family protein